MQVLPAVDSVQAAMAELPSDWLIVAPEIAVAPSASLVIFRVAVSKALRAALASAAA